MSFSVWYFTLPALWIQMKVVELGKKLFCDELFVTRQGGYFCITSVILYERLKGWFNVWSNNSVKCISVNLLCSWIETGRHTIFVWTEICHFNRTLCSSISSNVIDDCGYYIIVRFCVGRINESTKWNISLILKTKCARPLSFCFLSECTQGNFCVLIKNIGVNLVWNISWCAFHKIWKRFTNLFVNHCAIYVLLESLRLFKPYIHAPTDSTS